MDKFISIWWPSEDDPRSAGDGAKGFKTLEDFRGLRRNHVVPHSQIKRPDAREYHGGYEEEAVEGYARAEEVGV